MPKNEPNETRERQHEHHAHQFAAYHDEHHAEINQAKRLVKHLATHEGDAAAIAALKAMPDEILKQVPHAMELAHGKER